MYNLSKSWKNTCEALCIQPFAAGYRQLTLAYTESHRAYHTLRHISDCLELLDWTVEQTQITDLPLIRAALWFHDAVYDPHRKDNELKSAQLAHSMLSKVGLDNQLCDQIYRLVLTTSHTERPQTTVEKWIIDIDLAILGAEPARFAEYQNQIRQEYEWVPEETFQRERCSILKSFLESPHIYCTDLFRSRFEAQARENLKEACKANCDSEGD